MPAVFAADCDACFTADVQHRENFRFASWAKNRIGNVRKVAVAQPQRCGSISRYGMCLARLSSRHKRSASSAENFRRAGSASREGGTFDSPRGRAGVARSAGIPKDCANQRQAGSVGALSMSQRIHGVMAQA
jgi:hypothetical protein